MEWMELLFDIFKLCIIPLLGILTGFIVKFIQKKTIELTDKTDNDIFDKYINILSKIITDCVIATNQTYVDSLKAEGKFDAEAQKIAFNKTFDSVMAILSDEAKSVLASAFGDLTIYVTNQLEAEVNLNK